MHYNIETYPAFKQLSPEARTAAIECYKAPHTSSIERWLSIAQLATHHNIGSAIRQILWHEVESRETQLRILAALTKCERSQRLAKTITPETSSTTIPEELRIDSETARIAIALNYTTQHRIWTIIRNCCGSANHITMKDLLELLPHFNIEHNKRYLNRLIKKGLGIFWMLSTDKSTLYYRSSRRVGAGLVCAAKKQNQSHLYETNLPGGRDVWIPTNAATQSLQSWKAYIYAAWFAWRDNPTIARATVAMLFNATKETQLNWHTLTTNVLAIVNNDAQSTTGDKEQIPAHATQYMTWDKKLRYHWQTSNTYISTLRTHHAKGQARKIREQAAAIAFDQPVDVHKAQTATKRQSAWFDRSHRPQRKFHTSLGKLKQLLKTEERSKYPRGFRKQTMFVYLGFNSNGTGIWEYIPKETPYGEIPADWEPQTTPNERVPVSIEYRFDWLGKDLKTAERDYLTFLRAQGELA